MACNVAVLPAPIHDVFSVLADPKSYGYWVVGSSSIRDADPDWPAVGSRLHHRVGIGPFKLNDDTEVLEVSEPTRLVMHARARPFGTARVELSLVDVEGRSTQVTMVEEPGDRVSRLLHNPLVDFLLRRRNDESLRRLRQLAGRR